MARKIKRTTQNTALKIKLGYMGKMIDRETAARMLREIGYSDIDALAYLDKATPHIEFIRA